VGRQGKSTEKGRSDSKAREQSLSRKDEQATAYGTRDGSRLKRTTKIIPSRPQKRPQGIQVVQGHINGFEIHAIPDTGAEFNIMAATFAKRRGLVVHNGDPSKCRLLRMANGKHIKTVGVVDAVWSFTSDTSQAWKITFHILADFVYDLLLGSQFLFTTQTMSHHKERLSRIPRPLQSLSVLRVNVLGSASRQVRGLLQKEPVHALPDSGSEPSLLSYEYVKRRGWLMRMRMEDQNLLQFADGSVAKTEGSILATWVFPSKEVNYFKARPSLKVQFHILRGCSHDVILGQDALEESDMFLEHEDAFLDVGSDTEPSGLNLVIWLPKKKVSSISSNNQVHIEQQLPTRQKDALHIELQRRAAVDRKISRMSSGIEKQAAVAAEAQTRREYDGGTNIASQTRSSTDSTASSTQFSASSNDSSTSSRQTVAQPVYPPGSFTVPRSPERTYSYYPGRGAVYSEIAGEYEFNTRLRREIIG
jgi:hypothetical protein